MSKRSRQKFEEQHRSARKFFRNSDQGSEPSINNSMYDSDDPPSVRAQKRFKLANDLQTYIERNVPNRNKKRNAKPKQQQVATSIRQFVTAKQNLTKNEVKQLQRSINRKRATILPFQKEQVVNLRFDPDDNTKILNSYTEIAKKVGLKRSSVHQIVFHYKRNGFKIRVGPFPTQGKQLKLTQEQQQTICNPDLLKKWAHLSLGKRCGLLSKEPYNINISKTTLGLYYKRNRVTFTKPQKTLASRYPDSLLQFLRVAFIQELLNHLRSNREVLFFDETSTNLWEVKRYVWQPKDAPLTLKISPNPGKKLTIMGAVSSKRNILHYSVVRKTTTENVINFWQAVDNRFDLDNIVIVMDNHRAHSKATCERLEELGAIVLKLPVASSPLNPIEMVWGLVKQRWRTLLCQQSQELLVSLQGDFAFNWAQEQLQKICQSISEECISNFGNATLKNMLELVREYKSETGELDGSENLLED